MLWPTPASTFGYGNTHPVHRQVVPLRKRLVRPYADFIPAHFGETLTALDPREASQHRQNPLSVLSLSGWAPQATNRRFVRCYLRRLPTLSGLSPARNSLPDR